MTTESIEYTYDLKGVRLDAYNAVVKPDFVFAIPTYMVRRWASILGATAFWLLVTLQQKTYRNPKGNNWCVVSRPRLAEAAAMSEATVHRYLHGRPYTQSLLCHWVRVPSTETVRHRPRYRSRDGKLVQPPNRYTVVMDAPLAPVDQRGVAQYLLERGERPGAPAEVVEPALRELSTRSLHQLLDLCNEHADRFTPPTSWRKEAFYATVADVVRALGVQMPIDARKRTEFLSLCSDVQNAFVRQRYVGTQYFRRRWLPELGHKLALVVVYLRSLCFHNAETRRDVVDSLTFGQLAKATKVSARWLKEIDKMRPESRLFFRIERAGRGNAPLFRVNLVDPITPQDREQYEALLHAGALSDGVSERGTDEPLVAWVDARQGKNELPTTNVAASATEEGGVDEAFATKTCSEKGLERPSGKAEETLEEKCTGELLRSELVNCRSEEKCTDELLRSELVNCWSGEKCTGELLRSELVNREKCTGELHISTISTHISTSGEKALKQQHARASAAAQLLENFGIGPPASEQILARNLDANHIRAWMLYALTQPGLDSPAKAAGYVVNRLLADVPPPTRFLDWAQLTRSDWRDLWRAAQYGGDYETALRPELAQLFDRWCNDFADVFPAGPFGDETITQSLIDEVIAELHGDPATLDVHVLRDEGPIVVKPVTNSARDWLHRTENALRAALRQRGIYHRLRVVEEDGSAANIAPDPELDTLWRTTLEDLETRLARVTFDRLLRGSRLTKRNGGYEVVLRDPHAKAWVEARLAPRILDALARTLGDAKERPSVTFSADAGEEISG